MKKPHLFIIIICTFCAIGCQKNEGVLVGGINIEGTWVLSEYPNEITWYWTISKDHIGYYEIAEDHKNCPYFSNGYVYNNGNHWGERLYVKYELDGNDIYVNDMRMATIKRVINKNKVEIESSILCDGMCERVFGFR